MSTNAYAAKRAIIDRLAALAQLPGTALNNVGAVVQYALDLTNAGPVTVYGGGVAFDQPGDNDAVDGERKKIVEETATIGLHIRVAAQPPGVQPIRDTDAVAEEVGDWLGDELTRNPRIAGGSSITRIRSGQGDYGPTEAAAVSTLTYLIETTSHMTLPST